MRFVIMLLDLSLRLCSHVGRVGTQILLNVLGIRAFDNYRIERRLQQFDVVGVGAA